MNKLLSLVFVAVPLLWIAACGGREDDVAGGAGSESTNGIISTVYNSNGQPVAGAKYRIRPAWYYCEEAQCSAVKDLPVVFYADGITDADGRLVSGSLVSGNYVVEVSDGRTGVIRSFVVDGNDAETDTLQVLQLQGLSHISGFAPHSTGDSLVVQIYGTERCVPVDSSGRFSLDSVPPGDLIIRAQSGNSGKLVGELRLALGAGSIEDVDTLPVPSLVDALQTWQFYADISLDQALRHARFESEAPWNTVQLPLLLPLDRSLIDFSKASPDGADLRIVDTRDSAVPFSIRYWDAAEQKALLWVRVQDRLAMGSDQRVRIWYGKSGVTSASNPVLVWNGISDSLRAQLLTILVDNFEDGNNHNALTSPMVSFYWYTAWDSLTTILLPDSNIVNGIESNVGGRAGNSLHVKYSSDTGSWVLVGTHLALVPKDLRAMDSLVVWARGQGNLLIALENEGHVPIVKAWTSRTLSTTWTRYRVRPQDFDVPGLGDNVGWEEVKDSVNILSVFGVGGTEYWVDDIQLFGIHPLELAL